MSNLSFYAENVLGSFTVEVPARTIAEKIRLEWNNEEAMELIMEITNLMGEDFIYPLYDFARIEINRCRAAREDEDPETDWGEDDSYF